MGAAGKPTARRFARIAVDVSRRALWLRLRARGERDAGVKALAVLAVVFLAAAAGASARREGTFTGDFACTGTHCTGGINNPEGGPAIAGFYLTGGTFTNLSVLGHPGKVGTMGPGGAEEILFDPGASIQQNTTVKFGFDTPTPPATLTITPTYDGQTYAAPVVFRHSEACTAGDRTRLARLRVQIAKTKAALRHATGAHRAALQSKLRTLQRTLAPLVRSCG